MLTGLISWNSLRNKKFLNVRILSSWLRRHLLIVNGCFLALFPCLLIVL
ncbi:hypothetical protein HanPI659440_Chr02g0036481 [Helianthus annuus]|nr:hypothetical protein HanPI659440_Chr02g0036481 [Helianthus annuus]